MCLPIKDTFLVKTTGPKAFLSAYEGSTIGYWIVNLTSILGYGTFMTIMLNATGDSETEKMKKVPFQVYLEREQADIIGFLSSKSGKSKASVIRLCMEKYLESLPPEDDPALGIMKLGSSGRKDIAEKHDAYLTSSGR